MSQAGRTRKNEKCKMINDNYHQVLKVMQLYYLDAELGSHEKQSENALKYVEREPRILTKLCAKNRNRVGITDGEQVSELRRLKCGG